MVFRANEEEARGYQHALAKLVGPSIDPGEREKSRIALGAIIEAHGPVVQGYPHWHPLVAAAKDPQTPSVLPDENCGYRGLDHSAFLRNAFITCPYADADAVIKSVEQINLDARLEDIVELNAEPIEAQLYHPNATPVLVKCVWSRRLNRDGTIPAALAVPLILEKELPAWRWAKYAESWETMRPYLLGQPCGSRSSLFVDQDTGQTIKSIWMALINTGMYGPIKVGVR